MTKPRRYGGKSHPATPTQEQTRPISTETSNLDKKYAVFDVSCKNEPWKKKRCKLMTKPRRLIPRRQLRSKRDQYRRKLAIYTKNILFLISPAKTSLENENVASWWPNRAGMVENLIPRRQLRSKRDQYWRKLAIYTKNTLFLTSPAKTSLENKNVASWWPNRAGMVENLIPRRQLRSKRDQYRRKLAIYTKHILFLISPA